MFLRTNTFYYAAEYSAPYKFFFICEETEYQQNECCVPKWFLFFVKKRIKGVERQMVDVKENFSIHVIFITSKVSSMHLSTRNSTRLEGGIAFSQRRWPGSYTLFDNVDSVFIIRSAFALASCRISLGIVEWALEKIAFLFSGHPQLLSSSHHILHSSWGEIFSCSGKAESPVPLLQLSTLQKTMSAHFLHPRKCITSLHVVLSVSLWWDIMCH